MTQSSGDPTAAEVLTQVRAQVRAGKIQWSDHAEEKLAKRGISKDEAKECLLKGVVKEGPYLPIRAKGIEWEIAVDAVIDGVPLRVVAVWIPESHSLIVTVRPPPRK